MDWFSKFKHLNMGSLTDYLPQTGLECVSWIEFMKQATQIIKVSAETESLNLVKKQFLTQLPKEFKSENTDLISLKEASVLDEASRKYWGEIILQVYFESILRGPYINLDMRPENFRVSKSLENPNMSWQLSRFFTKTEASFNESLKLLYKGYYHSRPKDFKQALIELGLLGPEQDAQELENLLYGYFGEAGEKPIGFDTGKFKASFVALFKYLKKHRRKIPARLMWVGLALAGVYETLELLDTEYNVREVFFRFEESEQN